MRALAGKPGISDEPMTLHCAVENPSIVLVLDETLCESVDVTAGVPDDGTIIINTEKSAGEYKEKLSFKGRVFAVDASRISVDNIGINKPNTPMMGALIKATGIMDFEKMLSDTSEKLKKKFAHKPEVIEGNIKSIQQAYEEVKE